MVLYYTLLSNSAFTDSHAESGKLTMVGVFTPWELTSEKSGFCLILCFSGEWFLNICQLTTECTDR